MTTAEDAADVRRPPTFFPPSAAHETWMFMGGIIALCGLVVVAAVILPVFGPRVAAVAGVYLLVALLAPLIAPYNPLDTAAGPRLYPPNVQNWFGTDEYGRDVFSRVVYGARIAFTSNRDGNFDVYVMNTDGSDVARLTGHPERDDYPAWHPDGRHLVTVSERAGRFDLYLWDAP